MAVFFSGGGTTLQNLIDRIAEGSLSAEIAWTLSSREGVAGIDRSYRAGIPCEILPRKNFPSHQAHSEAINQHLAENPVDLIVLAGFMCLYDFPPQYSGRILNTHPALIPAFCGQGMYGHHVHEAVIASGAKVSGATIHFVNEEYDCGPIILQKCVPVTFEDSAETLAEKVQAAERELYPRAIQLFAEGRLKIEGNRVRILREEETP
jgi:phosphoribosylglycinamide formyltransferase-1